MGTGGAFTTENWEARRDGGGGRVMEEAIGGWGGGA